MKTWEEMEGEERGAKFFRHWHAYPLGPHMKQMFEWEIDQATRFVSHTWRVHPYSDGVALVEIVLPKGGRSIHGKAAIGSEAGRLEGDRLLSTPIWGTIEAGRLIEVGNSPTTCQKGAVLVVSISNMGRVAIDVTYALLTVGVR